MTANNTDTDIRPENIELNAVLQELTAIREDMLAGPEKINRRLKRVHAHYRQSARNLVHYLIFRGRDLRSLQVRLAGLGLSSLGRAESHVLDLVDAVIEVIHRLEGRQIDGLHENGRIDFSLGQRLVTEHTDALLGSPPLERRVRIMVTMPSEAGNDYSQVHNLLNRGMDCMRINCAHDEPETWLRMIRYLNRRNRRLGDHVGS